MKLRLLNVYSTHSCLALLTEHDCFEWIGNVPINVEGTLRAINSSYFECEKDLSNGITDYDAHKEMFVADGHISNNEHIHIIGDFENIEELKQWFQMQYLLDNISIESLKTITK